MIRMRPPAAPNLMRPTRQPAVIQSQAEIPFSDAPADTSVLVTLVDGSHLGFGDIARVLEGLDHPDSFGCDTTDGQLHNGVLGPLSENLGGPDAATVELECQAPCVGDEALGVSMRPSRQGRLSRAAVMTFVRTIVEGEGSLQELRDGMAAQPDAFIR